MGIQFILGLRTKRSHRNTSADSDYSGSVGKNIGNCCAARGGRRKTEGRLEFALPTAFCFLRAISDGPFCELHF
jgi:hypothetical protein